MSATICIHMYYVLPFVNGHSPLHPPAPCSTAKKAQLRAQLEARARQLELEAPAYETIETVLRQVRSMILYIFLFLISKLIYRRSMCLETKEVK